MISQIVNCPNCKLAVRASDINIEALVAKCFNCDRIFRLPMERLPVVDGEREPEQAPSRPAGILHAEGPGGELYMKRRWFHLSLLFLVFFCLVWDGFLVFWYATALFGLGNGGAGFWLAVLFPIGHLAVGVGLTYSVIAGFFNSTQIFVDDDSLRIRHRPIPWFGNRTLPTAEIQGIELSPAPLENGQQRATVSAHHIDGRQIVLLSGLTSSQAHYIAYHVAAFLDVPCTRGGHSTWTQGLVPTAPQALAR